MKADAENNEERVARILLENDGYMALTKLMDVAPVTTIKRMMIEKLVYRIHMSLNKGTGDYRRCQDERIIKKEYSQKVFVCLDRTAIVRLMFNGCQKPYTQYDQKILTHFLRKYLSKTEAIGVLWRLGIRSFRRCGQDLVKNNMQIDGVIYPRSRK